MIKNIFILASVIAAPFSFATSADDKAITVTNHKNAAIVFQAYKGSNETLNYKFSECFQVPDEYQDEVIIDTNEGSILVKPNAFAKFRVNNQCFDEINTKKSFHLCQDYCYNPFDRTDERTPKPNSFFEYDASESFQNQLHYFSLDKCTLVNARKDTIEDPLALDIMYSGNPTYVGIDPKSGNAQNYSCISG